MLVTGCLDDCAIPVGSECFEIAHGLATGIGLHVQPLTHVTVIVVS